MNRLLQILALVLIHELATCHAQGCNTVALKQINTYRSLHAVPVLAWDDSLAKLAQVTANQEAAASCNIANDGYSVPDGYEGLLAPFYGEQAIVDLCAAGIRQKYRTVAHYEFGQPPVAQKADQFARIVWQSTTSVGCAAASGTYQGRACQVVFCLMPSRNLSSVPDLNKAYQDNVQAFSALEIVWKPCKDSSFSYLNELRARHGLPAMSWNDGLAAAALDTATKSAGSQCGAAPLGTESIYSSAFSDCKAALDYVYQTGRAAYNFASPTPYEANINNTDANLFAIMMWENSTSIGCVSVPYNTPPCPSFYCLLPSRNIPAVNVDEANRLYLANAPAAVPDLSQCRRAAFLLHGDLRSLHSYGRARSFGESFDLRDTAQINAARSARKGCSNGTTLEAGQEGSLYVNSTWSGSLDSDPCALAIDAIYNQGLSAYDFDAPSVHMGTAEDGFAMMLWSNTTSFGCGAGLNYRQGCSVVLCVYPDRNLSSDPAARQQAYLDNVKILRPFFRPPTPGKKRSLGPIIGGVVGGIVVLGILAGAMVWWRRRKAQSKGRAVQASAKDLDAADWDVPLAPKPKPLVPGYQWVSQMAEGRTFLQAGVNDVQLDTQKQLSPVGSQNWTSLVLQLTPDQVADQIQLLSDMPMGSGACGHVYKCVWDSRFPGALLAAKILPKTSKNYQLAWQSFQHEVNILKSLNHPNIVRIYGFCLEQPTVCIIMELLDFSVDSLLSGNSWLTAKLTTTTGTDAASATDMTNTQLITAMTGNSSVTDGSVVVNVYEPSTRMSMKRVLRIAIDVALGLEHLHAGSAARQTTALAYQITEEAHDEDEAAGGQDRMPVLPSLGQAGVVIHRDIKPDNMLVNVNGQTKLCDFGISRETMGTNLQTRHEGAGTDRYMAPELLVYRNNPSNSGVVGKKVDIYSLGIVLYELVSHNIVRHKDTMQVLAGVRPSLISKGEPHAVEARLRELECSEEVLLAMEAIITRCWHHVPNKRPTATELKDALMQVHSQLGGTSSVGVLAS